MAGWNTCEHGFCSDCGYSGWEHDPVCDALPTPHSDECSACKAAQTVDAKKVLDRLEKDLQRLKESHEAFDKRAEKLAKELAQFREGR